MRIDNAVRPTLFALESIDPSDRQSWKRFGQAEPGREFLYRLYSEDLRLVYVGITWNPFVRWTSHSKKHEWWAEIAHVEIWECQDNLHARHWETRCIKELQPSENRHQAVS